MNHDIVAPVARLDGVSKTYSVETVGIAAVRDVSLSIPANRFSVIVGPSGSGKTTLLNLIGCIDAPTSGAVEILGQRVADLRDDALSDFRARHIGFVFQSFNLIPVLTAFENVEYPLLRLGLAPARRRDRALSMLEAVGLADRADARPNQLSGGQKQRVAIARALVKSPALVLADEPTANLDSQTGATIIALMRSMQAMSRTTFVISTHDGQMMSHADQTFHVRDGVLIS
jgi:putative ABC transport system ATP-binding protein